jgi:hypothetical protein
LAFEWMGRRGQAIQLVNEHGGSQAS